jgi:hypothetical protein
MAKAMAQVADGLTAIIEVASGHRRRAEEAGFSPTAAEQMALQAHHALLHTAFQNKETP